MVTVVCVCACIYMYLEECFSMVGPRCTRGAGQRMGKSATTFQYELWMDLELGMPHASPSVCTAFLWLRVCVCAVVFCCFLRVTWLFLFSLLIFLISVPPLLLCLEFSDLDFVFLFKWEGIGADGCHLLCFCQLLSFVFSLDLSFGSEDL